mmetsp:Transcript_63980/g.198080  ORF Transcript_63980/g.198080 Transcript_63980/m.198080 type:complete len:218 (-) Transcript_63980:7-660(-)
MGCLPAKPHPRAGRLVGRLEDRHPRRTAGSACPARHQRRRPPAVPRRAGAAVATRPLAAVPAYPRPARAAGLGDRPLRHLQARHHRHRPGQRVGPEPLRLLELCTRRPRDANLPKPRHVLLAAGAAVHAADERQEPEEPAPRLHEGAGRRAQAQPPVGPLRRLREAEGAGGRQPAPRLPPASLEHRPLRAGHPGRSPARHSEPELGKAATAEHAGLD